MNNPRIQNAQIVFLTPSSIPINFLTLSSWSPEVVESMRNHARGQAQQMTSYLRNHIPTKLAGALNTSGRSTGSDSIISIKPVQINTGGPGVVRVTLEVIVRVKDRPEWKVEINDVEREFRTGKDPIGEKTGELFTRRILEELVKAGFTSAIPSRG